jgi:hypothetical protein
MHKFAITVVLLIVILPASAAANPSPLEDFYISFDPDGGRMHEITPPAFTTVSAYVVADLSETAWGYGFTTASFRLSDPREDFPGAFPTAAFVNLLPGNLAIGAWNEGITVASTECIPSWPVVIGRLDCFYLGGPASICILDHPDFPHWVVDCQDPGQVWLYEETVSGRISGGNGICDQAAPVEDVSWGAIKSMYR